ncbi:hypothetical protein OYC64_008185 [Pagothenia borchgrevinki]|uniref:Uncharacterized protein n=1 Tax=Pagothenia borchgrevinki TaxID=8213 RepID=A0ABD2GV74_PAGBO
MLQEGPKYIQQPRSALDKQHSSQRKLKNDCKSNWIYFMCFV